MILSCQNICKAFGEKVILNDASFHIEDREKAALIGCNGAGKTTLLRIIMQEISADSGNVVLARDKNIGYLAQYQDIHGHHTIYEELLTTKQHIIDMERRIRNLEQEMNHVQGEDLNRLMETYTRLTHQFELENGYAYKSELTGVLKGLGFTEEDFDKQIETLSGGQKTRVALGKMLLSKPDILLLDEPTNHLDMESISWLETYLLNYPGAVFIVSHDRYFLDKVVTKVVEIEAGQTRVYSGNYSAYALKKAQLRDAQYKAYLNQQRDIKHQEAVIAKLKSFNREKSIKRAESREKMLDRVQRIEKPLEIQDRMRISLEPRVLSGNDVLHVEELSKAFPGQTLFSDISFDIKRGERVALIGNNGTGKTTMLKIINGLLEADAGKFSLGSKVQIGYYDQEHHVLHMDKTIFQEISDTYPTLTETEIRNMLAAFLFTGDDVFKEISALSGGERGRVSLAKLMLSEANFLILDEPTNHLDNEMVTWLEDFLRSFKGVVIMVTHDRYFLDRVTNKILEISHGSLYAYEANYSKFLELKAEREEMELASERKRQSVLRMELEWAKRGCRARSTKQRARLERLEALKNGKAPVRDANVELDSVETRMGKKTIELHHISKNFGDKVILDDFNYIVLRNQRLGIIGPNGCGKSTLIRIIDGMVQPDAGEVEIGETIRIGYFAQEVPDMDTNQRVIDYIRDVAEYIPTRDGKISATMMLERFLFDSAMQYAPIAKLSGGEKRRLYLLKVLMEAPNVLLLDEPSNDLDIPTLTILEDYLDSFAGIVIAVSHDRYFLDNIVDRIFAFEGNGHLTQYEGGYTDYTEALARKGGAVSEGQSNAVGAEKKKSAQADWKQNRPQKLKFTYKEQREFETIDDDIAALEELLEKLDKDMEANATNSVKLREIMEQKEKAQADLDEKMDRWVYLNDLAERIEAQKSEK